MSWTRHDTTLYVHAMPKQHTTTSNNADEPFPRLYSVAEVAKQFGVARTTVHRWINTGRLTAIDIGVPGSPRLRVPTPSIDAFVATATLPTGGA